MIGKGSIHRGDRRWLAGASFAALVLAMPAGAWAQDSAPQVAQDAAPEGEVADIVVTGFRQSLGAAINLKRQTVGSVDAIVAEDIAKFPDQNLAESLQRIPGISIQRDGGEGRAITVRGLGAQFTRVRVNGLETVATSTDGASSNRDRAFDFNVFASELFSSLVVHKTAEASLDEGSLGAVVDLNTGNPLAGKSGFTFVGSATGSYNDLSKKWGPRLAGLMSWKSEDGQWGVALSAAYSKLDTKQMGNNTVRWSQARFDSVDGTPCFTRANSGGAYVPGAACDEAALAFHPRIPRYGEIAQERERLGVTGSIQWAPSDATKVSIDGLFSRFRETREEKWGEVLLRSNERSIDVVNPVYDDKGNMISATLNDAWVRTEHYLRKSQTKFYQLGATWDQDVSDSLRFTLLGGFSKSDASIPVETTLVFDDRDAQGYSYDYSNSRRPVLTFGTSVTDPANFQLAEIRDRPSSTVNKFRTAQLRTEWDVTDGFTVKVGGVYRRFSFDTEGFTRDTVVCGNGGVDRVLGTVNCSPTSAFGPTAIYGLPVTSDLAQLFTLKGAGAPAGTTTQWLVPNLATGTDYTNLYERALAVDVGNTRSVVEQVKGGYLQFDAKGEVLGLEYALNAGVRYVRTEQSSTGLLAGVNRTIKRSYSDWLPAVNLAVFPHRDVVVRASVADVITRPSLGSLTPGGSVDGFNYNINFGNPDLQPYRATSYDLAVEWYFAPQSLFSVAVFKKDVSSFPISDTTTGTYASTGLPLSIIPPGSPAAQRPEDRLWNITRPINGTGASLKGIEIALQMPFTFLPGFLSHFGGIANATFVKSSATYTTPGPIQTACVTGVTGCAFGPNVAVTRRETLFGLSKRAFNATLYYEDAKFSARGSISYRSPYIDGTSGTGNVFEGYNSTINVDASVRYKLTDWIELSLEGINLTDDYRDRYTDLDTNRNYEQLHFGRTLQVGARFKL
ncbi:TonB-dependent receptor [Sphingobium sp. YR768]|uniref:TonB-dependent receptor n=1 Tax=Sphingobium sp. YR768 TaxID=1884365 RepID=UPI0008CD93EB|nr:TonB-dependent receptor [Sphingobium sp. YR768]SES14270.1 TonB-dependent receptor [Sphingobium sp. YR768]